MSGDLLQSRNSLPPMNRGFLRNYGMRKGYVLAFLVFATCLLASGCDSSEESERRDTWHVVAEVSDAALLAVHGIAASDVWIVGADDGNGPVALHFDGSDWKRHETGVRGDLWWVRAFEDGTVFMAGSDALVLRYRNGVIERLRPPGLGKSTIFGIWGTSPENIYAVGSSAGRNGFIWHFDGKQWKDVPLPSEVKLDDNQDLPSLTKVWGPNETEVWAVGGRGTVLKGNHSDGFELIPTDTEELLFAVHGDLSGQRRVVVGGSSKGLCLEYESNALNNGLPEDAPMMQGVWTHSNGTTWVSGAMGFLFKSTENAQWIEVDHELELYIQSLHSIWVDPDGGVWSVGGNVLVGELDGGIAIHNREVPGIQIRPVPPDQIECPEEAIDPHPSGTIARRWNEQLLNAIRRDTPRPTVHSRNLFHLSAALWDVWNAFNEGPSESYLVEETATSEDPETAMDEAMSYAAYRLLTHRYTNAIGGQQSTKCLNAFMEKLGYNLLDTETTGNTPRALGNRIAAAYISGFADDGANEKNDYTDPEGFDNPEPRLVVDMPGSGTENPLAWQQLVLAEAVTQNGISEGSGIREYIGAHWGDVTPFAMKRSAPGEPYYPNDNAPTVLNDSLLAQVMEVIRKTAWLDVSDTTTMDISPASMGNSPLGTDDGTGYEINPITGEPYESLIVKRSDFGRVLAEFWADGLDSETPPGHWNTIANLLADDPENERRLYGTEKAIDALAWDIHVYFALNGALHDAAIAAWELKREYLTSRPITLIRTLGARGQRSDPQQPSYNPEGLPLEPELVEVITEESSAKGAKHEHLSRYVGELAIRSWRGEPGDRDNDFGGHGWIRAKEWISYQRRTFVSPAFPGYASGHSTFSRAGAEVLAEITGSPYFPGGSSELRFDPGYLVFEAGPTEPIILRWATFYDAADQAGASRLWGGIHVAPDDFDGRIMGSKVGIAAMKLARRYFEGTASTP